MDTLDLSADWVQKHLKRNPEARKRAAKAKEKAEKKIAKEDLVTKAKQRRGDDGTRSIPESQWEEIVPSGEVLGHLPTGADRPWKAVVSSIRMSGGGYLTDPRPDLPEDKILWMTLLTNAYHDVTWQGRVQHPLYPELFEVLVATRVMGTRIERGPGTTDPLKIRPIISRDRSVSNFTTYQDWLDYRDNELMAWSDAIQELLRRMI